MSRLGVSQTALNDLRQLAREMPAYQSAMIDLKHPEFSYDAMNRHQEYSEALQEWLERTQRRIKEVCGEQSLEYLLMAEAPHVKSGDVDFTAKEIREEIEGRQDFIGQVIDLLTSPRDAINRLRGKPGPFEAMMEEGVAIDNLTQEFRHRRIEHTLSAIIERLEESYGPTLVRGVRSRAARRTKDRESAKETHFQH